MWYAFCGGLFWDEKKVRNFDSAEAQTLGVSTPRLKLSANMLAGSTQFASDYNNIATEYESRGS